MKIHNKALIGSGLTLAIGIVVMTALAEYVPILEPETVPLLALPAVLLLLHLHVSNLGDDEGQQEMRKSTTEDDHDMSLNEVLVLLILAVLTLTVAAMLLSEVCSSVENAAKAEAMCESILKSGGGSE